MAVSSMIHHVKIDHSRKDWRTKIQLPSLTPGYPGLDFDISAKMLVVRDTGAVPALPARLEFPLDFSIQPFPYSRMKTILPDTSISAEVDHSYLDGCRISVRVIGPCKADDCDATGLIAHIIIDQSDK